MTYLQKKKLAFMNIVNNVKGFVRTVSGVSPLTLNNCVDEKSVLWYSVTGEGVGDKTKNLLNPDYFSYKAINASNVWSNTYNKWVFIKAGTTYKFSIKKLMNCSSWRINFALFDGNKEYISNTTGAIAYPVNNYLSSIVCSSNTSMGWYQSTAGVFIMNGNITSGTSNIVITFTPKSDLYISFYINSGNTTSNTYAVEPQIEEGKTVTEYEPYNDKNYIIPISCSNESSKSKVYIFLDNPLVAGQVLHYKKDNLPDLLTFKGSTICSVDTTVKPNMSITYYSTTKE